MHSFSYPVRLHNKVKICSEVLRTFSNHTEYRGTRLLCSYVVVTLIAHTIQSEDLIEYDAFNFHAHHKVCLPVSRILPFQMYIQFYTT